MTQIPLVERIDALLPQTQCTRCGYPTCRAYAEAIADDRADINQCPPGGTDGVIALARLLGRDPKPLDPAHGIEEAPVVALIDEDVCIGCTKCIQACPVDAIVGAAKRMHTIIAHECTGCGLCLPPCPVDCIALVPIAAQPLARMQVLDRAAHGRACFDAREERMLGERRDTTRRVAGAVLAALFEPSPSKRGVGGDGFESAAAPIAAEAAPTEINERDARPISRSAVLEAIARGKARRRGNQNV
jgi:electron transport complex protein RnfB